IGKHLAHERKGKVRLLTLATLFATASLLLLPNPPGADAARLKKHKPARAHTTGAVLPDPKAPRQAADTDTSTADPQKAGPTQKANDPDKSAASKLDDEWSQSDIASAEADCAAILKRIHAVAVPHEPIKHGACGAPAPIKL